MYYFRKNGKILGPFDVEKLRELSARGMIERSTEISDDKTDWRRADAFRELFPDQPKKPEQSRKDAAENRTEVSTPPREQLRIKEPVRIEEVELPPNDDDAPPPLPPHIYSRTSSADGNSGEKANYLKILWDPVNAVPEIYRDKGDKGAAYAGLSMIAISALCLFWAIKASSGNAASKAEASTVQLLILLIVPFASLIFASFITRKFFGPDQPQGGFGGDCLISGSAFLLISLSTLVLSFLPNNDPAFFTEKGIFIILAVLIYTYTSSVLILYSGCTCISGVAKSVACIVVPLMIAITAIVSGLLFRYIIEKTQ